jgi:HPt (histidine-containing phosphotransfer) domain-containing protein
MTQTLIDEKAALEALNGDRQLLGELATMFVEDAPTLLQALQSALDCQDQVTAHRTIHSLRGLSSTFFAVEIVELAGRLEQDVKSGNFESLRNGGLLALKHSIDHLLKELQESGYTP